MVKNYKLIVREWVKISKLLNYPRFSTAVIANVCLSEFQSGSLFKITTKLISSLNVKKQTKEKLQESF